MRKYQTTTIQDIIEDKFDTDSMWFFTCIVDSSPLRLIVKHVWIRGEKEIKSTKNVRHVQYREERYFILECGHAEPVANKIVKKRTRCLTCAWIAYKNANSTNL